MWSRAEVSPCSRLCPCFLPLLCRGPGTSPCHSTTYSPKPLLSEGFSPGKVSSHASPLISHANRFFHRQPEERARRFGRRSFHLPSSSAKLPLAPGCRSQTQVKHLSQLRETTKHWHQVNSGAGEQSTAGSSGLMLCSLRDFHRAGHEGLSPL